MTLHSQRGETCENPSYEDLIDFARWTQTFWKNGIEIMRKNNLVIKSDDPMEKLAFTFYTNLCEINSKCEHLFEEGYAEENYKDESVIQSQTIKSYPKPYEENIRKDEQDRVLKELRKIVAELYDDGFKNPLVTFEAAVNKMRYGDLKIRKNKGE